MHVHNVYFWLTMGTADAAFESGLAALASDPNVRHGFYGPPSGTDREVVESGYTYGLVLVFDDRAGHDAYQAGAAHLGFLDAHADAWDSVIVYDFATAG